MTAPAFSLPRSTKANVDMMVSPSTDSALPLVEMLATMGFKSQTNPIHQVACLFIGSGEGSTSVEASAGLERLGPFARLVRASGEAAMTVGRKR